jgi:hypothetical protein
MTGGGESLTEELCARTEAKLKVTIMGSNLTATAKRIEMCIPASEHMDLVRNKYYIIRDGVDKAFQ